MTNQNETDWGDDTPAKISIRVLIKHPRTGWRNFDLADSFEVYTDDDLSLRQFANLVMKVAYAHVLVRNGVVLELESVRVAQWRFDNQGKLDQEAVMKGILAKLDAGLYGPDTLTLSHEDQLQIQRLLGLN
ncbi:hypothetical protein [Curvibacter gracilis]|uniref:hypothetical protein n=1 Tax=Curvibacter gracilis TaxID=230310 RepID=UPI0005B7D0CC|nr:hypothetical protein [Curvibacter gracilis]